MTFAIDTELLRWPKIRQVGPQRYRIKEDFIALWDNRLIELKVGFEFDGASIPRMFWHIIGSPMSGRYTAATAIHDGLYAVQHTTRREADDCMYDLMRQYQTLWIQAATMHRVCRIVSGRAWAQNARSGLVEATRINELVTVVDMRQKLNGDDAKG